MKKQYHKPIIETEDTLEQTSLSCYVAQGWSEQEPIEHRKTEGLFSSDYQEYCFKGGFVWYDDPQQGLCDIYYADVTPLS